MKYWICARCTYKNATKTLCSMCRAKRGAPPLEKAVKDSPAKTKASVKAVQKASPAPKAKDSSPAVKRGRPPVQMTAASPKAKSASPATKARMNSPVAQKGKRPSTVTSKAKERSPAAPKRSSPPVKMTLAATKRMQRTSPQVATPPPKRAKVTKRVLPTTKGKVAAVGQKRAFRTNIEKARNTPESRQKEQRKDEEKFLIEGTESEKTQESVISPVEIRMLENTQNSSVSVHPTPSSQPIHLTVEESVKSFTDSGERNTQMTLSAQSAPEVTEPEQPNQSESMVTTASSNDPTTAVDSAQTAFDTTSEPNFHMASGALVDIPEEAIIAAASKYDLPLPEKYANEEYLRQKALERSASKGDSMSPARNQNVISYRALHFQDPSTPASKEMPEEKTDTEDGDTCTKKLFLSQADDNETQRTEDDKAPSPAKDARISNDRISLSLVDEGEADKEETIPNASIIPSEAQNRTDNLTNTAEPIPSCKTDSETDDGNEPQFRTAAGAIIDIPETAVIAAATKYELPLPPKYSSQEFLDKRKLERTLSQEEPSQGTSPNVIKASEYVFQPPKPLYRRTPAPRLAGGEESAAHAEDEGLAPEKTAETQKGTNARAQSTDSLSELTAYELPEYRPPSPFAFDTAENTVAVLPSLEGHRVELSEELHSEKTSEEIHTEKDADGTESKEIEEEMSAKVAPHDNYPKRPSEEMHSKTRFENDSPADLQFRTAAGRVLPISTEAIVRAAKKYDLPIPHTLRSAAGSPESDAAHGEPHVAPKFVSPFTPRGTTGQPPVSTHGGGFRWATSAASRPGNGQQQTGYTPAARFDGQP